MAIYQIRELSFTFPGQAEPVLKNIDLNLDTGEFVALCGRSGSGKSTLLRQLKPALAPHGERSGEICYAGQPLAELDTRRQAAEIGFVLQHPDNSVVTDKVWHELAFGLESLGYDQQTIRLRVAEMASFFGIQGWFHASVSKLSGGQKQLLQLASVMAMQPAVLILDEPTSQLDPIAALEFIGTLARINRELGTTIVLSEHRLEEVLHHADRLIVMDAGRIVADAAPAEAGAALRVSGHPMFRAMPSAMRIHAGTGSRLPAPLTVRDGRAWLYAHLAEEPAAVAADNVAGTKAGLPLAVGEPLGEASETGMTGAAGEQSTAAVASDAHDVSALPGRTSSEVPDTAAAVSHTGRLVATVAPNSADDVPVLRFRDVWFRYDKHGADVLKSLSLEVRRGQWYCILGGNGTGKTTTLALASGLHRPHRGKVQVLGSDPARTSAKELFTRGLALLPQQPQTLFVQKTVALELADMLRGSGLDEQAKLAKLEAVTAFAELKPLLEKHPYDLSGGEQQRAALAKILLLEPQILLLDEPTKGLDGFFKEKLAALLQRLQADGVTIVMVSHDVEFCARYAEVCALFFDGAIIAEDAVGPFFTGNSFYTTAANRMARDVWGDALTVEEVVRRCREEAH